MKKWIALLLVLCMLPWPAVRAAENEELADQIRQEAQEILDEARETTSSVLNWVDQALSPFQKFLPWNQPSKKERDAYRVYYDYLREHQLQIALMETSRPYDWKNPGKCVIFRDFNNDYVDDMLVAQAEKIHGSGYGATVISMRLLVITCRDHAPALLFRSPELIIGAGGGDQYALFSLKRSSQLLLGVQSYRESSGAEYLLFADPDQEEVRLLAKGITLRDAEAQPEITCYLGTDKISPEQYQAGCDMLLQEAREKLLWNGDSYWSQREPFQAKAASMPLAEGSRVADAMQYCLTKHISCLPSLSPREEAKLLEWIGDDDYLFASGAGGWGDKFHLNPDGSFSGTYSNSDYEEDPEMGTLAVQYICPYEGRISNLKKVSPFCFAADLSLTLLKEPDQVWLDPDNPDIKFVSVKPYGLDETSQVLIYLPGMPMADIPESYRVWNVPGLSEPVLKVTGIANLEAPTGRAFFGFREQTYTPESNREAVVRFGDTQVTLTGELFSHSSLEYSQQLAQLGGILCDAVGHGQSDINQVFRDMGVDTYFTRDLEGEGGQSNLGAAVAGKTMYINGRETSVLFVVARGTQTATESLGDFLMAATVPFDDGKQVYQAYDFPYHFSKKVLDLVSTYLNTRGQEFRDRPLKVFITGHSLGGSAANLVGAVYQAVRLAPKEDTYVYTFGSIDSIRDTIGYTTPVLKGYENFHNIYNELDTFGPKGNKVITTSGHSGMGRFGHMDLFSMDFSKTDPSPFANHLIVNYLQAVNRGLVQHDPTGDLVPPGFWNVAADGLVPGSPLHPVKLLFSGKLKKVVARCPVDVEIRLDGRLVGAIRDGVTRQLDYSVPMLLWVRGDAKKVVVPEECTVHILARDSGTMDVEIETQDRKLQYPDIPLSQGLEFAVEKGDNTQLLVKEGNRTVGTVLEDGSIRRDFPMWTLALIPAVLAAGILTFLLLRRKRRRAAKA